nr:hypothetical protein [Streptomyces qinglanensis]
MEGVAAVGLGAGRTAGGAAVAAADQEVTGGQVGGVEAAQGRADLAGGGVYLVFGAVAGQADGVGAAAQAGELTEDTGQGAGCGQVRQLCERGGVRARDDGASPSLPYEVWEGAWLPGRRMLGGIEAAPVATQRWWIPLRELKSERRTSAATATDTAVTTTAAKSATTTTPPTITAATAPEPTEGSDRGGAGVRGAECWQPQAGT